MADSINGGLAPVAIFAYNRPVHLLKTLTALAANDLAGHSRLIIFSDGAKSESDQPLVAKVRALLGQIEWRKSFAEVELVFRQHNYGLSANIIDGVSVVVGKYGQVIVLEDDLVVAPNFLAYMNEGLRLYAQAANVASIHGWVYPVKNRLPQSFFLKGADCLGWATWKRAWDVFEIDGAKLWQEIQVSGRQKEFDFGGSFNFSGMLVDQVAGKNNSWAVRWYASAFLKNMLTLYPGFTLVSHIGYDQGTNCNSSQKPEKLSGRELKLTWQQPQENLEAKKIIIKHFCQQQRWTKFKRIIKKLIRRP